MSNYQEGGGGSYAAGSQPQSGSNPYQEPGYQEGGAPHQGGPSFDTGPQHGGGYQGGYTETQRFQGSLPHHEGGRGQFQGGHFGPARHISVRSTFKTTEFWIFVVVSLALLIAAAVTDSGVDGQGFGARQAWLYVTALAIAYILSRGLTKFGGHERDDRDRG